MNVQASGKLQFGTRLALPAVLFLILGVLIVLPLLTLVYASLITDAPFSGNVYQWTLSNYVSIWTPEMMRALWNTAAVSVVGTAIALSIGTALAWLSARSDIPCKPLVHLAGMMPLFVSLIVAALCWSLLGSGRSGYLNILLNAIDAPFRVNVQSLGGIIFVHGIYYVSFPFLYVYSALTLVHPDLEEAASVNGASLWRMLTRVTLPLVKPALVGSALLLIVVMAEEFPVPQILGGPRGIETLSIRIFNLMHQVPASPKQASAVAMVLTAFVAVLIYFQRRLLAGRDYQTVSGKGLQTRTFSLGKLRWVAFAFVCLYIAIAIVLPLMALVLSAFRNSLYIPNIASFVDWSQYGTRHLKEALSANGVVDSLWNSLICAVCTAGLGGALYFVLSYTVYRTDAWGRRALEFLTMVPLALPALVMGLGILWTWANIPLPVYGTLTILIIAYLGRFAPQGFRAISSSMLQIHGELEEAAMVAGATKTQAVRRIMWPLMRAGVAAAMVILFVLALRELTASLFLYTTDTRVLSIVIYEQYENGGWSVVASLSLIYTIVLVSLNLLGRRWMRAAA